MAVVQINTRKFFQTLEDVEKPKLELAGEGMVEDLLVEAAKQASQAGAPSLADSDVYKTHWNVGRGFISGKSQKALQVDFGYDQSGLKPGIGEMRSAWRFISERTGKPYDNEMEYFDHTSPTGDDPKDYRWLVNSGHAGGAFRGHKPAWDGHPGYFRNIESEYPTIVENNLRKAGLI